MLLRKFTKNWTVFLCSYRVNQYHLKSYRAFSSYKLKSWKNSSISENRRGYSSADEEFETIGDHEPDAELDSQKFCLKRLLYGKPTDGLLQDLNECLEPEQILEVYRKNKQFFKSEHFVQSIICLWSIRNSIKNGAVCTAIKSNIFEDFLQNFKCFIPELKPDEITCSFLYLNKLGVDIKCEIMTDLIIKCGNVIVDSETDLPLTALSRFCVGVNSCPDFNTSLVCKDVIPHIIEHINNCTTAENLRLITISMHNICALVTMDILSLYKDKVESMIRSKILNSSTDKCILKVINFLNIPNWSQGTSQLVRSLVVILVDNIDSMPSKNLELLFRIFQSHLEPASFLAKSIKRAQQLFHENPTPEIFSCIVHFAQFDKREQLSKITRDMFLEEKFSTATSTNTLYSLFKILRSLKICDTDLCDKYWLKVLNEIEINTEERKSYRIIKHCHRYMHFNNNLGGTYRNHEFEKNVCDILINEVLNGISSVIPSRFARLSSFIISYGHVKDSQGKFPERIIEKIEDMSNQFSVNDCLQISRGLQISSELRNKKHMSPDLRTQLLRINNVLNNCAEKQLESNISFQDLNVIIRSLNNRRASRKTPLYQKALNKYKQPPDVMNSRIIRDITYNLNSSSYLIPEILDEIWCYILRNKEHVISDTVEKVLSCSYNLGYTPNSEDALYWTAEIIKRDFEFMSGLSIVQACMALCYYKVIPEQLINKVFCIDFIKRIEDEMQICYSKETYPERVLNQIMQLNRAVCLDFPESQVPWFQQNFIEAQMSKQPVVLTRFHYDMKKLLTEVVRDEKLLRCNHVTPYGYRIDFVIHLDKNLNPIQPPKDDTLLEKITKVAILLLRLDSFCENNLTTMRGPEYLKMRHLEMLGYKVIHINLNDWNSMYMNVPGARVNYLKNLLHIE